MLKIVVEGTPGEGQSAIAAELGRLLQKHGMRVTWDDPTGAFDRALVLQEHVLKQLAGYPITIEIKHVRADTIEARVGKADVIAVGQSSHGFHVIKNRYGAIGHMTAKAFAALRTENPTANILVV